MQVVTSFRTLFLSLSFTPFLLAEATDTKQGQIVDTVSSVTIDNTKKMVSYAESTPFFYTETIRNVSSDKPAFVNIDTYRLNNIGEEKEDLTKVELSGDADVYAMPSQIVVPAGGVRTVRIYLTKKLQRDRDQYFRIRFSPSTSPLEEEAVSNNKKSRSSLFVGMGAGQLLMVSRNNPSFNTKVTVDKNSDGKKQLVIQNGGNSFIRLENLKTCYGSKHKKPCKYSSGRHVNAGDIKKLPIDDDVRTMFVEIVEGNKIRHVEYDQQASNLLKVTEK